MKKRKDDPSDAASEPVDAKSALRKVISSDNLNWVEEKPAQDVEPKVESTPAANPPVTNASEASHQPDSTVDLKESMSKKANSEKKRAGKRSSKEKKDRKSKEKESKEKEPKEKEVKDKELLRGKEKQKEPEVLVKNDDDEARQLARKIPSLSRFKMALHAETPPADVRQSNEIVLTLAPPVPNKPRTKIHSTKSHQITRQGLDTTRVVTSVARPIDQPLSLNMVFESNACDKVRIPLVLAHMRRQGRLDVGAVLKILEKSTEILKSEPNILDIKSPCTVFGDVHGQFYDVINILEISGTPPDTQCLFLGDYVDRGMFGIETLLYLLSFKINFPESLWMIRGNHESRQITQNFNFHKECLVKYNEDVYNAAMNVFDALPLAAVVHTNFGDFFCVHGGIGPDVLKYRDIKKINRFQEPQLKGPFASLLWSDPINPEEYPDMTLFDLQTFYFRPNEGRGSVGWLFGQRAVNAFLSKNKCVTLVRGHEVQQYGIAEHYFGVETSDFPKCITVFSAPNYCEIYKNKAAFLKLFPESMDYEVVEAVDHPYILPDFMNGISFSLSFVVEIVAALLLKTAHFLFREGEEILEEEQEIRLDELFKKSKASVDQMKRQREERMQLINKDITKYFKDSEAKSLTPFEMAVKFDKGMESAKPKLFLRRIKSTPF